MRRQRQRSVSRYAVVNLDLGLVNTRRLLVTNPGSRLESV